MISDRIWLAPAWVRWLVNSAVFMAFLVPLLACVFPTFLHRAGWLWVVIASLMLSLIEGGVALWVGGPARRRQLAVLDGPNNTQRAQALAALRSGEAPAEHAVLVAAIRVGDLRRAYRRGASRGQRAMVRLVPLILAVVAVAEYFGRAPHIAELFAVVAVVFTARLMVLTRRTRRADKNLATLRAAADSSGLASETADAGEVAVALPKRRALILIAAASIPYLIFVAVALWVDRSRPDCHTVHEAATFIYDSRQLEETQSLKRGSLDVAVYQAWSDRLQGFGGQASNPAVAPRLRHIGELSVQVVSQVRAIQSAADDDSQSAKTAFYQAMRQLIDEDNALMAYCF